MSAGESPLKLASPWDVASRPPTVESSSLGRPTLFSIPDMPPKDRLAERLEAGKLFRAVVDHQRLACLMVDASARLFDSSTAGAALLEMGMWLKLRAGGRLACPSEADTTRLRALAKRTAHGRGGSSMRIRNESGAECLIQAIPAGARWGNPVYRPHGSCVSLFVTVLACAGRELASWIDVAKIRILLRCTQAEAEVATFLLAGLTPARIARDRRVSLSTVRTQIRALLEVSGTRRVAELIVVLARSLLQQSRLEKRW